MSARTTWGCTSRAACWALGTSEMTVAGLDPRTPVVVGVGQAAERIKDPGYAGLSPIDLAVAAARAAVADSRADGVALIDAIDTIAATRQFEHSSSRAVAPLGKSTKLP